MPIRKLILASLFAIAISIAAAAQNPPVSVSGGPLYFCANGSAVCAPNNFQIPSGNVFQIGTDTGCSRDSAGVIDCGNGTAGNKSAQMNLAIFNAGTGFQINAAAPSRHYPCGNGTNYVDCTIAATDLPLPYIVGAMYNTSQYTNATTSLTTILTSPSISAGWLIDVDCELTYSVTGTAEKFGVGLTASQTAQNMDYDAFINYSAAGGNGSVGFTGTATTGGTALTSGAVVGSTASSYGAHLHGRILWNATTAGTFTLQAQSGNAAGTVTINAYNSSCQVTRLL
jgi:hypothetical protein